MNMPVLVLGAGGHAKVLIDALLANSALVAGIIDADPTMAGTTVLGIPVLGGDEIATQFPHVEIRMVNGLGSIGFPAGRQEIFLRFKAAGYSFATIIHPAAVVASDVGIGEGAQVMAAAVVQPGSRLGQNVIINTKASVDHDCVIGNHVHLAPGVTLSGGVTVGDGTHIGTGATVIQGVRIGTGSIVGAGALVLKDVPDGATVMGVPAKVVRK